MPDEPDESDDGDPTDGSEEPRESPEDPERGSPIDPSDLDTRADATDDSDGAAGNDDAPDGTEHDTRADAGDTGADGESADRAAEEDGSNDAGGGADDDAAADEIGAGDDDDADGVTDDGDASGTDDGPDVGDLDDFPTVKPDPVDIDSSEGDEGSDPDAGGEDGDREPDGSEDGVGGDEPANEGADEDSATGTEDADEPAEDAGDADDEPEDGRDETPADDMGVESGDDSPDGGTGLSEVQAGDPPEAQTDGEGYVHDQPRGGGGGYDDDLGGISTPPDDEEMPLADHIEEMVLRLAAVFLIGAAGTAIGLLGASPAIDYIWQNVLPASLDAPPHVYHPLELWLTRIKVAALLGILVGLPMFVYQCYLFMRPGLYPNERKYYLSAVPMSLVLAVVGMFISFVLVLPILFRYFTYYSEGSAGIAYALGETFNLIITLTGFLAIVFQIPLFVMLAIMMGVTTRRWLADKRLYFWAAFFGLSFMFTIDPTLMAPIIVGILMIGLFEGTLFLLKWTGQE